MTSIESVLREALARVKPKQWEYYYLEYVAEIIARIVRTCLEEYGFRDFEVSLQGSFAKDTFISGDVDIDLFILFKPGTVRTSDFEAFIVPNLKVCLERYGLTTLLEYATHPYVTTFLGNVEINIVPAFRVRDPSFIISPVDRTPFHTEYVNSRLSREQRDEVRLLKAFMKGIGVYGAEVRVQGFSGYLAELLVIAYGSFENVLRKSLSWRPYRTCIDVEGYYASERDCLKRFPKSVLIVVDPVDPKRNVAAAVGLRAFSKFRVCSRLFLERPSIKYFEKYEPRVSLGDVEQALRIACSMNRKIILVVSNVMHRSEDVVWGQIRRFERSLINQLRSRHVKVMFIDSYLDARSNKAMTFLEVYEGGTQWKLHEGPPAHIVENSVEFIKKNLDCLVGPWIDHDNRLVCIRKWNPLECVAQAIKGIHLEFVKPTAVVDLCSESYALSENALPWLYECITRSYFKYLLKDANEP